MPNDSNLERLSPNDLVSGFTRSPVVVFMFAAIAFHVVVIGMSSVSYITDQWIDPEGAQATSADEATANPGDDGEKTEDAQSPSDTKKGDDPKTDSVANSAAADGGPKDAKDGSAIEHRVTEKATDEDLEALRLLGPETDINPE